MILNGTVLGVSIAEPTIDPSSPEWGAITTSDGYRILVQVDHLGFNTKPSPLHEGAPFKTQPKINAYDIVVSWFYTGTEYQHKLCMFI